MHRLETVIVLGSTMCMWIIQLLGPHILTKTWKENISEEGRYTERGKEWEKKGERERQRGSSDGDQKQGLNINAARLRDFRAAVHQNLGERATVMP